MFHIGQRWYSEGEPELGLGIVTKTEDKLISILYPLADIERTYNKTNPPLKRFTLEVGEEFKDTDETIHVVDEVIEKDHLIIYIAGEKELSEVSLSSKIDLSGPVDRLLAQSFDNNNFYELRYQAYLAYRNYEKSPYKGFLGAKMSLIPHQIYLAHEILSHPKPRYMLCDEVGLGKTIEASIILHALLQREIISSAIIIVPESLVNQWFVELYRKFSLKFRTISEENPGDLNFKESQNYIVSSALINSDIGIYEKIHDSSWDMLIVDESHQVKFKDKENKLSNLVRHIATQAYGVLFLSATPEVLGEENLYSQLSVLEPQKYTNFSEFKEVKNHAEKVSALIVNLTDTGIEGNTDELETYLNKNEYEGLSVDAIIAKLVDRFGQGRSYFRNSRASLEKTQDLFTKRKLKQVPIPKPKMINDNIVTTLKASSVFDIIEQSDGEKILVICHSKDLVKKVSSKLRSLSNVTIAEFHSDQSLLERDRQAAYFADPEGAQLLICTEVGSEGRNFEFANNLILLDLPKIPDQLEQRIGRLDRIGQKRDINIYVPYIKDSFEEILFRWYHEVLGSFERFPKGGMAFYQKHRDTIIDLIENHAIESLDSTLEKRHTEYVEYQDHLEKGRDFLIEKRSFNFEIAKKHIDEITSFEQKDNCKRFLGNVCEAFGINFEQLNEYAYFLQPSDNMLLPSFPGLDHDGISVSFNRPYANRHHNIDLMNWEHPIVQGAFELLLNSPLGNVSISQTSELPRNIYFEFIVALRVQGNHYHETSMYLPFTPFRSFLDIQGNELTNKISKKQLDDVKFEKVSEDIIPLLKSIPKDQMTALSKNAVKSVHARVEKAKESAVQLIKKEYGDEIERLQSLDSKDEILESKIERLKTLQTELISEIRETHGELDAIRVIFPRE